MEEDKTYSCKLCYQPFETKSSLLRHISHKKICREHYGEAKFEDMRRNSRLASKSNWNKKQTAKEAKRYQTEKEKCKIDSKRRYVSAGLRKGYPDGEAFSTVYKQLFEACHENIGEDKLFDRSFDVVHDTVYAQSVDHIMKSTDYQEIFVENTMDLELEETDDEIANEIEKAMKEAFENYSEIQLNKSANDWTHKKENEVFYRCFERGERRAFSNHFEEFKATIYQDSVNNAMDEAFEKFDQNGDQVEQKIEKYDDEYYRLVKTSESKEFAKEIEKLLERVFKDFQKEEIIILFNQSPMSTKMKQMINDMMANEVRLIFKESEKD